MDTALKNDVACTQCVFLLIAWVPFIVGIVWCLMFAAWHTYIFPLVKCLALKLTKSVPHRAFSPLQSQQSDSTIANGSAAASAVSPSNGVHPPQHTISISCTNEWSIHSKDTVTTLDERHDQHEQHKHHKQHTQHFLKTELMANGTLGRATVRLETRDSANVF